MHQIQITTPVSATTSLVTIGRDLPLQDYFPRDRRVVLVVDSAVMALHGSRFGSWEVLQQQGGEGCKSFSRVEGLVARFVEMGLDRGSFIVGVGGGSICDMVGFAASIFMRGVGFGFVSTTLLSQVDASVGGKNGVNVGGYKNMAGLFSQPSFVVCDSLFLDTLSADLLSDGLAEVVKAALICDRELFLRLESEGFSYDMVERAVAIKADIVERDFRELRERRLLNLGHTFAHALEAIGGYCHGRAVGVGISLAADFSARLGMISREDVMRIRGLLSRLGLPVDCQGVEARELIDAMCRDKKRVGGVIEMVLLSDLGRAEVVPVEIEALSDLFTTSILE